MAKALATLLIKLEDLSVMMHKLYQICAINAHILAPIGVIPLGIHHEICCSHGSREIMNPLPSKFGLSPPLQLMSSIKELNSLT